MTTTKGDPIRTWPLKEKPRQVTREELKRMTPEAINMAREQGALDEVLGRIPPEPSPPAPTPTSSM
jgi:hypothetical protein